MSTSWVLVSEPVFFLGFGSFPWKCNYFTRNETQEQHSLSDTIFEYIFDFPPVQYFINFLFSCSAGDTGRHVVGFLDLFINVFLEVQDKTYSKLVYLIDYIV